MNPRTGVRGSGMLQPAQILLPVALAFFALALERRAEDVAQRGAGIGGAVLRDRLLLLGHLERLDRELHLVGAAVEQHDAGVDLLADLEAIGTLVVAVARE